MQILVEGGREQNLRMKRSQLTGSSRFRQVETRTLQSFLEGTSFSFITDITRLLVEFIFFIELSVRSSSK